MRKKAVSALSSAKETGKRCPGKTPNKQLLSAFGVGMGFFKNNCLKILLDLLAVHKAEQKEVGNLRESQCCVDMTLANVRNTA